MPPGACSAQWELGDLPAWGTAALARFWVAVEQPGPWGHDAFASSHLDPALGRALESATAHAGGRALLIRRPGRAGDARVRQPRQVFVAVGAAQGRPTLLSGRVEDVAELLELPWETLRRGEIPDSASLPHLSPSATSVALICTNAKRDVCCALRGLPLAAQLSRSHPERVWECSHTGGHRFAPTGVLLPTGTTLGRLDERLGDAALAAPGHEIAPKLLDRRVLRGLAHLTPRDQAVDAYARIRWGLPDVRQPLHIDWASDPTGSRWTASVDAPGVATTLRVAVSERVDPASRPASCGRDAGPSTYLEVTDLG